MAGLHIKFLSERLHHFLRVNLPFSSEPGSSELMCCGLACLRLDMVQPSGAKSYKQFSSPSSTNSSAWKISPSSRNAHVNVIIIINNALRFITLLWQLIGSGPSAHTLFKCAPYWWEERRARRGREEPCEWMDCRMEAGLITPNSSLFSLFMKKKKILSPSNASEQNISQTSWSEMDKLLTCGVFDFSLKIPGYCD